MGWFLRLNAAVAVILVVMALALLAVGVAVVVTAVWSGESRNRDLARRGWDHLSRW